MKNKISTKDLVVTALLIAIGIIIPTCFGFLRVILPPAFTASIMAHVPIFIAMFISPLSALLTAIGTTIGFLVSGVDIVVTARAGSHIVFALIGAYLIKKKYSLVVVGIVTAILHALFEALTVYIFLACGITNANGASFVTVAFYTTGIGTLIHSVIDYILACIIGFALSKARAIPSLPKVF